MLEVGTTLRTIWEGKGLVAFFIFALTAVAFLQAFVLMEPLFEAKTTIILETREERVVSFESVLDGLKRDDATLNTEVAVMQGRDLLSRVVDNENLVEDPEFNRLIREQSGNLRIDERLSSWLRGFTNPIPEGAPPPTPETLRERVITALADRVSVRNVPDTFLFEITVRSEDASKSAHLADAIATQYVTDQLAAKDAATTDAIAFLSERAVSLRTDLDTANARVSTFRARQGMIDDDALAALEQQLAALRFRYTAQSEAYAARAARAAELEAAVTPADRLRVASDPDLDNIARTSGPDSAAFSDRYALLLAEAQRQERLAADQVAPAEASLNNLETTISAQSASRIEFAQLQADARAAAVLSTYFNERLQQTLVQQGLQRPDSRILTRAVKPESAISPRKKRIVAIGAVLGALLGVVVVLVRSLYATRPRTIEDIEVAVMAPVLGQMPCKGGRQRAAAPFTPAETDAIRNLRTSLLMAGIGARSGQSIAFCATTPEDRQPTPTLALASSFADLGKRILLIDGNLREPAFPTDAATQATVTLAGLLSSDTVPETLDLPTVAKGVHLLSAGTATNHSTDLLSLDRMPRLIRDISARFDLTLIDAPAALALPDARLLAGAADATLLVVRWNASRSGDLRAAATALASAHATLKGAVVTGKSPSRARPVARLPNVLHAAD